MSPAAAQLDAVRPPDAGAWTELLRARSTGPLAVSQGTGFGTGIFACEAGIRTIRHERGRSSVRTTWLPVAIKRANHRARGWNNYRIAASRDAGQVVLNEFVASLDPSEEVVRSTPCPRPDGVAIEAPRDKPYVFTPRLTIASRQCRGVAPARLNPGGQLSCRVPDQVLRHSAHCTGIIEKCPRLARQGDGNRHRGPGSQGPRLHPVSGLLARRRPNDRPACKRSIAVSMSQF